MRKILTELYSGNLEAKPKVFVRDSQYEASLKEMYEAEQELLKQIEPEQKCLLESFINSHNELCRIAEEESFVRGFRFGVKLLLAGLSDDTGDLKGLFE